MGRAFNFSGGPATLPEEVLREAADEMTEFENTGYSVLEMSHRSGEYMAIYEDARDGLRQLMNIPDHYEILFLQGGATLQFSMVPLNLMAHPLGKADYVVTGIWAKKAAAEAKRYGQVQLAASSEEKNFTEVPLLQKCSFRKDADYIHLTTNNTIFGTRMVDLPPDSDVPLVVDASSHILAEPLDVNRFGLIYAGAQKNIGIAGLAVVIVDQRLLGRARPETPVLLNYAIHAEKKSAYNTPPVFAVYMAGKVFRWCLAQGGVSALHETNLKKATLIYDYLDRSQLFYPLVQGKARSLTNVTFRTHKPELENAFFSEAEANGMVNLKGHRWVGGMRASLYNAMPLKGVAQLVAFMEDFEKRYGD